MTERLKPGSIVDCHTHTRYSDGVGTFEENARAAVAAGCCVLVSTDHLTLPTGPMDPKGEVQVVENELAAHRAEWEAARDAHPELEFIYGFEADWYPGCEDNVTRWGANAQVLLGSVHWLGTLPERMRNEGFAATIDLAPLWDEMTACARDTGRRVELSTAGWRKGVGDYYPSRGLLERFCHAGVPITVGSDAHVPADMCEGIRDAYAHAWSVGYRSVEVPRADGTWESMPLQ